MKEISDKLLTVPEASALLSMSRAAFYQARYAGRLPFQLVRLGRSVRVRLSDVEAVVKNGFPLTNGSKGV